MASTTQTSRSGGRNGNKGQSGAGASTKSSTSRSKAGNAGGSLERDENYNLISVLYHALQGAETNAQYVADAESAGDEELVEFFTEVQAAEQDRAARAKALLAARVGAVTDEDE